MAGEAEVGEFGVAVGKEEYILGFEVPIDDLNGVEVLKAQDHAGYHKLYDPPLLVHVLTQVAHAQTAGVSSCSVLHHQIQVLSVSKRVLQLHYKLALSTRQDLAFQQQASHDFLAGSKLALHSLHGQQALNPPASLLAPHQEHTCERPLAHQPENLKPCK